MSKFDELRRKARAATPGPWTVDDDGAVKAPCCPTDLQTVAETYENANAEYIAAVSPDAVIAMADSIDVMRAALVDLRQWVDDDAVRTALTQVLKVTQ
jgi:hypothetical protein